MRNSEKSRRDGSSLITVCGGQSSRGEREDTETERERETEGIKEQQKEGKRDGVDGISGRKGERRERLKKQMEKWKIRR